MFDIHCHIIYGVDDGSDSLDESVKMAALALQGGTTGIIATPHCNIPGSYTNLWNRTLYDRLNEIREAVKKNNIPIQIFSGQEIFCTADSLKLIAEKKLITLNNSRYVLVEFPFNEYTENVFERMDRFLSVGLVPVIAHPERYYFIQEDEGVLFHLKSMGCVLQMNKGSLNGGFGENASEIAEFMLENELVDCIASDGHSPYSRTPYLEDIHETISDDYDIDYADLLLEANPKNIICNKPLDTL